MRVGAFENLTFLDDQRHLVEEPGIDTRRLVEHLDGHAAPQQFTDPEDAIGCGDRDRCEEVLVAYRHELPLRGIRVESVATLFE